MSATRSPRRVLLASASALAAATALLVLIVLPSEYGWDPLGTGEALGLLGLAESGATPLQQQSGAWQEDSIEFRLAPFESVEYKYRLEAGDGMVYAWEADGELLYEMHSEPDGAAPGYAESFAKDRARSDTGNYTAPFGGIHGWFWQNRGQAEVRLRLKTAGFYDHAIELLDGHSFRYEFK